MGGIRGKELPKTSEKYYYNQRFYDKFPGLLIDDPEDEHHHIISALRDIAESLLEGKPGKIEVSRETGEVTTEKGKL